jgi:hypothetical protein
LQGRDGALGVTKRGKNQGPLVVVLTKKIRTSESRERGDDAPGVCRLASQRAGDAETAQTLEVLWRVAHDSRPGGVRLVPLFREHQRCGERDA